ncbi:MAG: glycoside hydrolase family 18 protein [Rhodanobacter sp.]
MTRDLSLRGVSGKLVRWILLGCMAAAMPAMARVPAHYRVVGYDTVSHGVGDMDASRIDVLIFAFALLHDGRVGLPPDAVARLQKLTALKATDPRLQVMVSVGGWGAGGFSEAAATPAGRALFADSAARMLAEHDADGLDVDWEYPGNDSAGITATPADRGNFTALLKALRARLDTLGAAHGGSAARHYRLTIAAADNRFVDGIDIAAVAPYLDWFNLMTYDFNNSMTPVTGHHAGLFASADAPAGARTTRRAVRQFLAAGVPSHKLVIGVAFYGRQFADVRALHDGLYQPFTGAVTTPSWKQLQENLIDKHGYVRHWDKRAQAPFLWNAATRSFISYDDPDSIAAKGAFVRAWHLGGIMYWQQEQDTQNQLLDAIYRGLHPVPTPGHGSNVLPSALHAAAQSSR